MPSELTLPTPRSPCLRSDTPLDSCLQSYPPPNSPRVHTPPQDETLDCFEQAVERLTPLLGKVEITNKCEDATPMLRPNSQRLEPRRWSISWSMKCTLHVLWLCLCQHSTVQLGSECIQIQSRGVGAARGGDEARRVCVRYSCPNR